MTLESRICALGFGGHLAVELLLGRPEFKGKAGSTCEREDGQLIESDEYT